MIRTLTRTVTRNSTTQRDVTVHHRSAGYPPGVCPTIGREGMNMSGGMMKI